MGSSLLSYMSLWLPGIERSRRKLKSLYIHNHSAYDQKPGQDGNLPWWVPVGKVIWPLDYVVDYAAN